jgi:hypothetical protein
VGLRGDVRTSAASAALRRASSRSGGPGAAPPRTRPGPPTVLGTGAEVGPGGGADPTTRPGLEKLSDSDFPQMFPILLEPKEIAGLGVFEFRSRASQDKMSLCGARRQVAGELWQWGKSASRERLKRERAGDRR